MEDNSEKGGRRPESGERKGASLTESITGILKMDIDLEQAKEERLREKYGLPDDFFREEHKPDLSGIINPLVSR